MNQLASRWHRLVTFQSWLAPHLQQLVKVLHWLVVVDSTSVLVDLIYEPFGFTLAPVGDFSVLVGSISAAVGESLVLVGSGW